MVAFIMVFKHHKIKMMMMIMKIIIKIMIIEMMVEMIKPIFRHFQAVFMQFSIRFKNWGHEHSCPPSLFSPKDDCIVFLFFNFVYLKLNH